MKRYKFHEFWFLIMCASVKLAYLNLSYTCCCGVSNCHVLRYVLLTWLEFIANVTKLKRDWPFISISSYHFGSCNKMCNLWGWNHHVPFSFFLFGYQNLIWILIFSDHKWTEPVNTSFGRPFNVFWTLWT